MLSAAKHLKAQRARPSPCDADSLPLHNTWVNKVTLPLKPFLKYPQHKMGHCDPVSTKRQKFNMV